MNWRKPNASNPSGNCFELASADGCVLVRDSRDRDGPQIQVPAGQWRQFVDRLRKAV